MIAEKDDMYLDTFSNVISVAMYLHYTSTKKVGGLKPPKPPLVYALG